MSWDSKGTLNRVMLIGRLGQDLELKHTPSGAAVLTLSIATNTSYKGSDGNAVENTEWHRVVAWRKLAEIIAQYAKKGSRVYVEGKLATRSWNDKADVKHYSTEVIAEHIQLLDSRNGEPAKKADDPGQTPFTDPGPQEPDGDDLPF